MSYEGCQKGGESVQASDESLSESEITERLRALADEQRRVLVGYLVAADGPTSVDDVVEQVATATGESVETVRLLVRHTHVPKLEAAGLVARDADRLVFCDCEFTEELLETIGDYADP